MGQRLVILISLALTVMGAAAAGYLMASELPKLQGELLL
jgi:hypothetical protein